MLDALVDLSLNEVWYVFAVFLRIGPAVIMAPGFGEKSVSVRARLVFGLVLSAVIAPVVRPLLPPQPDQPVEILEDVFRETVIGFFFGLFARAVMYLLEMTGVVISQSTTLAQMFPGNSEPVSIMTQFLMVAGLAVIFSGPLVTEILNLFLSSYLAEIPRLTGVTAYLASRVSELVDYLFAQSVVLGSGILLLFFVYYLFTGFVNKKMPQLMVVFIGVPFVALMSIEAMRRNTDIILEAWQQKALTLIRMPLDGWP